MSARIFDAKAGEVLVIIFEQLDFAGDLVSGVAGSIVATLRDEDGAAAEAVVITEQGASGFYEATLTPTKSRATGFTYLLRLKSGAGTNNAILEYTIRVFPTISVSATTGSFLTTLANLKLFGDIAGTAHDTLLTDLIARLSRLIEDRLDETIISTIYQEISDGPHDETLNLRHSPMDPQSAAAVTAIYVSRNQTWDATTLLDAADFIVDPIHSRIWRKGVLWVGGFQNIRVDYTAGWASIPLSIEQLAISITLRTFHARKSSAAISKSLKDGSITRTLALRFSKEIDAELAPYRKTRPVVF